jgi:eukaryotic-like serine/threonine-protein kinase
VTAPHLGPGHAVGGKYTVRALLGFTGEAATYHAAGNDGREVVVKLYDPAIGQRADVMSQLDRVRGQVAQLPPGGAVPVLDAGYDVGTGAPFIVTEHLRLPSLAQLLQTGALSIEVVGAIVEGAGAVLDQAHRWNLFHHALKPSNVFVGPAPHYAVRVTDFGTAVVRSASPTHEAYARSAPWWAPEQLQPAAVLGPATDVFAMALIAFYALTGRSYWLSCQGSPPDLPNWQIEVMGQRVPTSQRARELGSSLHPSLDGILARALAVSPSDRPRTVGELARGVAMIANQRGPDSPKTMALPEMAFHAQGAYGGAGYPPAAGYAQPQAQQSQPPAQQPQQPYAQQPYAQQASYAAAPQQAVSAPGGYVAASGGYGSEASTSGQAPTAGGLPPFPQPVRKRGGSVVPIVIGVAAAVLLGGGGMVLLFMGSGSDDHSVPASSAPASGAAADTATASTAAASADTAEPADSGTATASDPPPPEANSTMVDVRIQCIPGCDKVFVDRNQIEKFDAPIPLPPGKHTFELFKSGFRPYAETITVEEGKPLERQFVLKKGAAPPPPPPKGKCGQFLKPCK